MNKSKGFTIIELIVVIAIIAVLAAIVLANVTGFINKGKDAAAEGNLATLITNATLFYSDTNKGDSTYNGFPADSSYISVIDALSNAGYAVTFTCDTGSDCHTAATSWCASVLLKANSEYYCVDSTGAKFMGTKQCQVTGGVAACGIPTPPETPPPTQP